MDQRHRFLVAAVVGAGVVLGTAGVFLYHQLYTERRRLLVQQTEIHRLDRTVSELRTELSELKVRQRSKRCRRPTETDSECDMFSAVGTDDEDDEFFDLSDEEQDRWMVGGGDTRDPVLARLFPEVDQLLVGPADDKRLAHRELLDHLEVYPDCSDLLWRLAKSCSSMAAVYRLEGDEDKRKEVIMQGCHYGERAIALSPDCADCHKWYAILVGSRGEYRGTREKIEDGYLFKQHVDLARQSRADDPSLSHLLGRFKYEVATLSWIERKVAGALYAEPPNATFSDAVADFERAETLSAAPWKENRLLLGKCHAAAGDYAAAIGWLDRAAEVPIVTPDDESAHRETEQLIAKYSGYRQAI